MVAQILWTNHKAKKSQTKVTLIAFDTKLKSELMQTCSWRGIITPGDHLGIYVCERSRGCLPKRWTLMDTRFLYWNLSSHLCFGTQRVSRYLAIRKFASQVSAIKQNFSVFSRHTAVLVTSKRDQFRNLFHTSWAIRSGASFREDTWTLASKNIEVIHVHTTVS